MQFIRSTNITEHRVQAFRSISNERGFLEIEYLIAAGLAALLLAALAGALAVVSQSQRVDEVASAADDLIVAIATTVKSGNSCSALLAGRPYSTSTPQPITLTGVQLGSSDIDLSEGASPPEIPGLRIRELRLIDNPDFVSAAGTPYTVESQDATPVIQTIRLASLRIVTERVDGDRVIIAPPRDIPIKVTVSPSDQIVRCNAEASEARLCAELGGRWDPTAAPPLPRCMPWTHCEYGGSFSPAPTFPVNKGGFDNPLSAVDADTPPQGCNLLAGYRPQQTGTISWAESTGKYRLRNEFYPVYTCVRCGNNPPSATAFYAPIDQDASGAFADEETGYSGMGFIFGWLSSWF